MSKTLKQFITEASLAEGGVISSEKTLVNEKIFDKLFNRDVELNYRDIKPLTTPGGGGFVETDDPEFVALAKSLENEGRKIGDTFGRAVSGGYENMSKIRQILGNPRAFVRLLELGGNRRYRDVPNLKEIKKQIKEFLMAVGKIPDKNQRNRIHGYFYASFIENMRKAADLEYRRIIGAARNQGASPQK